MTGGLPGAARLASVGMALTLGLGLLATPAAVMAAPGSDPSSVDLGDAATFAVLAGSEAIRSTGKTLITGDVGIDPWPTVAGFPPATVLGEIHRADRVAEIAKRDLDLAYEDAAGRVSTATHASLGGLRLVAGVYSAGSSPLDLTGTLTLDGANDPASVWIFQSSADFTASPSSRIVLVNGALACNVFWQVAGSVNVGAGSRLAGTILAATSINLDQGATLAGRALARDGSVTLAEDVVTGPGCAAPLVIAPVSQGLPVTQPVTQPVTPAVAVADIASPIAPVAADASGVVSGPLLVALIALMVIVVILMGEQPRPRRVRRDRRWRNASGW